MYKILIKEDDVHHLWASYGVSKADPAAGNGEIFEEFSTDDKEQLKAEVLKLDAKYGHENILIVSEIKVDYIASIAE